MSRTQLHRLDPGTTVFDSAPIEEMASSSTSELAPILDAARKQWRYHPFVLGFTAAALCLAVVSHSQPAIAGIVVFGVIAWPAMFLIDRHRLTITLIYDLQGDAYKRFNALVQTFDPLKECRKVWRIPTETLQTDQKRNAGASHSVKRNEISLRMALPSLIKSNLKFPTIPAGKETIYFAPDVILVVARRSIAALEYDQVEITATTMRFIESERLPKDATVVGQTWQYVNKKGGPDRRFSNNRELPICLYGEMDFKSSNGLNERIHCSHAEAAKQFASFLLTMQQLARPQVAEKRQEQQQEQRQESKGRPQESQAQRQEPQGQPQEQPSTNQLTPALLKVVERLDIRIKSYERMPNDTKWHFDFEFTCRNCGGHNVRLPDNATDASPACCGSCGAEFGRLGDIKAAGTLIGQRTLRL